MRRHKIFRPIFRFLGSAFLWLKFGYKRQTAKNLPGQYIVLSNHTTDFDPLFVGACFPKQMYFVASEHISRWPLAYKFLRYALEPILRYKGSVASSTVKEILKKTRAGENVCMFAEGGRSWDGQTLPILPSTAKVVKKAGCALVTFKLTGGYFIDPNWSEARTRRGPIRGGVVRVYSKEELEAMTAEEVYAAICQDLQEDACARQLENPQKYKGKNPALGFENLLYICPKCGEIDTFSSEKDTVTCAHCGLSFTYDEYGMLHGLEFSTVQELAAWQRARTEKAAREDVVFTARVARLSSVMRQQEELVAQGELTMDSRALACGDVEILLEEISEMALHGRRALVFTANKTYYELIPQKGFNALKFLELYRAHRAKITERVG